MNKIFKIFFVIIAGLILTNCANNDEEPTSIALKDFTEQRNEDDAKIIKYLKEHKITVLANYDVTFEAVPSMSANCMWVRDLVSASNPNPQYPLVTKTCKANDILYTIYYYKLRQGSNIAKTPCNLDGVWSAYKGRLMDEYVPIGTIVGGVPTTVATGGASLADIGTVFDSNDNPTFFFNLDQVVRGWAEVFPEFAPGSFVANVDGTVTYSDFGAGVMFLPSGLAYFNAAVGSIPSYSPLIFNFKLFEIRRNDHDNDGIEDFNEDVDDSDPIAAGVQNNRYIYTVAANSPTGKATDDTDSDGIPDAYDIDDDNDFYLTRTELKRPSLVPAQYDSNGVPINTGYYQFDQIPSCSSGGVKKHLDKSCN